MTDRQKDDSQGNNQRRLDVLLRLTLAAVFLWAGVIKIADPHQFATAISNYQLLPDVMVNAMAVWLPWIEVVCGVLLICGVWIDGSLVIVNTLLSCFHGGADFELDSRDRRRLWLLFSGCKRGRIQHPFRHRSRCRLFGYRSKGFLRSHPLPPVSKHSDRSGERIDMRFS